LESAPVPSAPLDFVAVTMRGQGSATFGHRGEAVAGAGVRTVLIGLKDLRVAPISNHSGYPNAMPRARAEKLFENDRVIVWRYRWKPGEPTPMHFHDKDVVVVYMEDTFLRSTTPDGKSVVNEYKSGDIRFNRRDRIHTETLVGSAGSAIITEIK
jgi:hypothetical protein